MINIKHIFDGWKNAIIKNPIVEEEAKRRAAICSPCELSGTVLGENICTDCGCPLVFKTRSRDASCTHPDGEKWKSLKKEDDGG